MYNYSQFIEKFNEQYIAKIEDNLDKIIEAFVIYYGEKYRDKITTLISNTNFFCYIPNKFKTLINDVLRESRLNEDLNITYQLLNILEIPNMKDTDCVIGNIISKYGKLTIIPNQITNTVDINNLEMDDILTTLFGETNIFSYDYQNMPLYNFFNLNKEEQLEFIKKVFKTDKITDEIIENIKKAIDFMNELKQKTNGYQKYIDTVIILKYYEYLERKRKHLESKKLISEHETNDLKILNRIIATTSEDIPPMIIEHMSTTLITDYLPPIIALPYMLMTDIFLIHEFNHVVTSEILATIDQYYVIERNGVDTYSNFHNTIVENSKFPLATFEEILNERSAMDITKIFHELGGSVFDDSNSCDIEMRIPYREMSILLESFYQEFCELIKEARITLNSNLLYKYFDKKTLEELKSLIAHYYTKLYFDVEDLYEDDVEKINELLKKLKRLPYEEEPVEDYLAELESKGYKVKRMFKH